MLPSRMQDTAPPRTTPGHRAPRRASWGLRIGLIGVLILAGLGIAAVRYYDWCQGASGPRTPVSIEVAEGAGGSQIVDDLHEQEVVRCGLVSKWLLRRSGLEDRLRAGTFELTTNMTPDQAFGALTAEPDPTPVVRLTIPEGYRVTQIAERVEEAIGIPPRRFLGALENGDWALPPYLPESAESPEGFLFPETYEFRAEGTRSGDVIAELLDQFRSVAEDLPWDDAEELDVTPYEVVVIASMIEEEAALEEERDLIAGVIYNRLEEGMVLGIDATLLYDDPTPRRAALVLGPGGGHPVQHAHQRRPPAHAHLQPGARVVAGRTGPGRHSVLLLRAVRGGRPPRIRADARGARAEPGPMW